MRFETAEISLLGDREENQDRAAVYTQNGSVFLVVADGMGGHEGGALAAETAVRALRERFQALAPEADSEAFLREAMEAAHDAVVAAGEAVGIGSRPRTTCAACLVREGVARWAHVGDSRIYYSRAGELVTRTRDHTPVESLLQDGLISEEEIAGHPMRHYVEYCLGGVSERPLVSVSEPHPLAAGELVLICSDGLWSGIGDADIARGPDEAAALDDWLARIASRAVRMSTPYSDNTTAAALRARAD